MNKKNLILGGVLVFLVLIAYLYQGPFKSWKINHEKSDNFLSSLNFDLVDRMEIGSGEDLIILLKEGEKWRIEGTKNFYLTQEKASSLKNIFEEANDSSLTLVSENVDKKNDFKTDENGLGIKLVSGDSILFDFILGDRTNDYRGSYISKIESPETYSIDVDLVSVFAKSDWYDKTIFSSNKDNVKSVRFQYNNDRSFIIEKDEDEAWAGIQPYKFSVDEEKITEILNIMTDLQADDIPEQTFEGTGLENHEIIVQVTGENIDNTIMIGGKNDDGLYYAKRADNDNIYLITEEIKNELDKRIRDFR